MGRTTEAWVSTSLFECGIGYVLVSRSKGIHEVEAGMFLVDVYCLGVKFAVFRRHSRWEHDHDFVARVFGEYEKQTIEPAAARRLVEGAVAYAAGLGFAPHSDYKKAARVFGGISAQDSTASFSFGNKGKPLYVQGPHDSPERVRFILKSLHARCGKGNYDYLILATTPGLDEWLPEESKSAQSDRESSPPDTGKRQ